MRTSIRMLLAAMLFAAPSTAWAQDAGMLGNDLALKVCADEGFYEMTAEETALYGQTASFGGRHAGTYDTGQGATEHTYTFEKTGNQARCGQAYPARTGERGPIAAGCATAPVRHSERNLQRLNYQTIACP